MELIPMENKGKSTPNTDFIGQDKESYPHVMNIHQRTMNAFAEVNIFSTHCTCNTHTPTYI